MNSLLVLIGLVMLGFWLIPASVLTIKIRNHQSLSQEVKRQLIRPLWLVPLVGNIIGYFFFTKTGKLNRLTQSEHRRLWSGHK